MQLGMIGLGRMGANLVRRLLRGGHECVVFDVNPESVERLRYADGDPLAVMRNWLPPDMVALDARSLERTGLYQLMRAAGIGLHLASQTIGARGAGAAEAKLLQAHKGEPLLTMERTTYNENGQPVELGDHLYRASLYSFEIVLVTR